MKTKAVELPNRPRNQRSLADFSNQNQGNQKDKWWKPVLDGTISHSREEEVKSAEAANVEVVANSLENEVHTTITIDHREANSTLPTMLKLNGHNVTMQNLAIGDIRISDRVLIERKTARDLIDSLIDGRLIHQARKLHSAAPRPLLIVESLDTNRVHPNALYGAMAWITIDLGLPIMMTGSPENTARFISIIAKRESRMLDLLMKQKRYRKIDTEKSAIKAAGSEIMSIISGEKSEGPLSNKWAKEIITKRTRLLAELPGIGQVTAEKIMAEAKDIMGLCSLSEEELTNIEGVSSTQAKELYKFLHG